MRNIKFKELETVEDIREVVNNLFDVDLNISAGWGYGKDTALIVGRLDMPTSQFTNLFVTLRTNIEMSFNFDKDNKYGGIILNEKNRKEVEFDGKSYSIITFNVTAMLEKEYAKFIKEYKDNYGKKEFDIAKHFKQRKEQTLSRVVECWFYLDN